MFDLSSLIITLPILLVTIAVHEFSHAKVADLLGDATPRHLGRLTLNPFSHIDPIGLLMLVFIRIGWAKPVPVNPYNFSDPKKGMALVAVSGPASNFFMAYIFSLVFKYVPLLPFWQDIIFYAIWINCALAIFNLLPIPPLDGSNILQAFLPDEYAHVLENFNRYGFFILLFIIFFMQDALVSLINFVVKFFV